VDTKMGIQLKDVKIQMRDKLILKNINLKIKNEESLVIIGPSGSGKTLLLKTIAGILPPHEGVVEIFGQELQKLELQEKHDFAKKLGMLFQQGALFDTETALENVAFPIREHSNLSEDEVLRLSRESLDEVNLLDSEDKIPSELSGGMQRRLGIARALALNPAIIFCDDPVAGQDPMQADQMIKLIKHYREKNNSILIMITSSMQAAYKVADRILMVIDEEVIDAGSPKDIEDNPDPRIQQFIHGHVKGPITKL
jgi:phospholipid/cholesterol/gamma-HCH transport system ATP-binding protein